MIDFYIAIPQVNVAYIVLRDFQITDNPNPKVKKIAITKAIEMEKVAI